MCKFPEQTQSFLLCHPLSAGLEAPHLAGGVLGSSLKDPLQPAWGSLTWKPHLLPPRPCLPESHDPFSITCHARFCPPTTVSAGGVFCPGHPVGQHRGQASAVPSHGITQRRLGPGHVPMTTYPLQLGRAEATWPKTVSHRSTSIRKRPPSNGLSRTAEETFQPPFLLSATFLSTPPRRFGDAWR